MATNREAARHIPRIISAGFHGQDYLTALNTPLNDCYQRARCTLQVQAIADPITELSSLIPTLTLIRHDDRVVIVIGR